MELGNKYIRPFLFAFSLAVLLLPKPVHGKDHPYLLFDASEISHLRSVAMTTHAEIWHAIKKFADDRLLKKPPSLTDAGNNKLIRYGNTIVPLAFAYVITGDPQYADLTKEWIFGACALPHWRQGKRDNYLAAAHLILGVSFGFD
jgi:hypothetical protein